MLFGIEEPQFLITAAHVLEESRVGGSLNMGIGSRILAMTGRFASTEADATGAPDIGVCVFPVRSNLVSPEISWITPAEIEHSATDVGSRLHVAIGFPHTQQASRPVNGVLDLNAMIHWGNSLSRDAVSRFGHNPNTHLLVEFDKNEIIGPGGATTSVDPYGMSGGGIWSAPRPLDQGGHPWRLAAIAIEWLKGPEKALLGTRIQHALETMSRGFTIAAVLSPFVD